MNDKFGHHLSGQCKVFYKPLGVVFTRSHFLSFFVTMAMDYTVQQKQHVQSLQHYCYYCFIQCHLFVHTKAEKHRQTQRLVQGRLSKEEEEVEERSAIYDKFKYN